MSDNAPVARPLGFAAIKIMPTELLGTSWTLPAPTACPDNRPLPLEARDTLPLTTPPDWAVGEHIALAPDTTPSHFFENAGSAAAAATGWRPG